MFECEECLTRFATFGKLVEHYLEEGHNEFVYRGHEFPIKMNLSV